MMTSRVLFLLQDTPRVYGAERVTVELMRGLRAAGADVRALLIGESRLGEVPGGMFEAVRHAGVPVERLSVGGRFSWVLVRAVRARLKALPGSIVHTVGYKAHVHALVASRGLAPAVTTIHGWLVRPEFKERAYEWIELQALRHDEAVVCLSSHYERLLLEKGVARVRLHRITTGLDPSALPSLDQAAAWAAGPFTVALLGRLSWEKNHGMLLRALQQVRARGLPVRAVLAGEGPERAAIEAQVKAMGLEGVVEMPGYANVASLLPSVHALVLCSRIENLPLSLLEAMAWARPVVATRVGGIPDLVADGETGYLVPDDDAVALAAKLQYLAENPLLARRLGEAGRRRVETEFSLARSVTNHLALYSMLTR